MYQNFLGMSPDPLGHHIPWCTKSFKIIWEEGWPCIARTEPPTSKHVPTELRRYQYCNGLKGFAGDAVTVNVVAMNEEA